MSFSLIESIMILCCLTISFTSVAHFMIISVFGTASKYPSCDCRSRPRRSSESTLSQISAIALSEVSLLAFSSLINVSIFVVRAICSCWEDSWGFDCCLAILVLGLLTEPGSWCACRQSRWTGLDEWAFRPATGGPIWRLLPYYQDDKQDWLTIWIKFPWLFSDRLLDWMCIQALILCVSALLYSPPVASYILDWTRTLLNVMSLRRACIGLAISIFCQRRTWRKPLGWDIPYIFEEPNSLGWTDLSRGTYFWWSVYDRWLRVGNLGRSLVWRCGDHPLIIVWSSLWRDDIVKVNRCIRCDGFTKATWTACMTTNA